MKKILIIEDDRLISQGLQQALEDEGYQIACAFDGADGLYQVKTQSPDLVVLDVMMPHLNGFEVVTEVRRQGDHVPILILSARTDTRDKIRGLDLGADDYLAKPFDLDELLARIRRLLKGNQSEAQIFGAFTYSWQERRLCQTDSQHTVALSTKELKLLEFLLKRQNQIVSREQILDAVWGSDYDGTDRTVDNTVVSLRKKIGDDHLLTERGLGYRFVAKP